MSNPITAATLAQIVQNHYLETGLPVTVKELAKLASISPGTVHARIAGPTNAGAWPLPGCKAVGNAKGLLIVPSKSWMRAEINSLRKINYELARAK